MSVPNFSSLACLKVTEKFVGGWWGGGGFKVAAMSNLNGSSLELL